MKKAISLLLLAALLCGTISCSDSGNGGNDDVTTDGTTTSADTTVTEAETTADNTPKLGLPEDLKYDGYTFTFYGRADMENKFIADDELSGDTMNDVVWMRQQKVSELLDVNFEYLYCSDNYAGDAQDIILAGDDTYDVILPHARFAFQYAMSDLTLNWLTDLKYVDLDTHANYACAENHCVLLYRTNDTQQVEKREKCQYSKYYFHYLFLQTIGFH